MRACAIFSLFDQHLYNNKFELSNQIISRLLLGASIFLFLLRASNFPFIAIFTLANHIIVFVLPLTVANHFGGTFKFITVS